MGNYFFGDYVNGWINRLDTVNGNAVYAFARSGSITDIQVGPDGALYALTNYGWHALGGVPVWTVRGEG